MGKESWFLKTENNVIYLATQLYVYKAHSSLFHIRRLMNQGLNYKKILLCKASHIIKL